MLYNKMRVEEDVRKKLLSLLDSLTDPSGQILNRLQSDLGKAVAGLAAAEALAGAATEEVAKARKAALEEKEKRRKELEAEVNKLQNAVADKQREIGNAAAEIARKSLPRCHKYDYPCKELRKRVEKAIGNLQGHHARLVGELQVLQRPHQELHQLTLQIEAWSDKKLQQAEKSALSNLAQAKSAVEALRIQVDRVRATRAKAKEYLKVWNG
ncbi:hypothetical protein XF30_03060 [Bradyrhizobium sp. SUTN9-2]|nr:hypothetical protein XF30_03060 [Bradyrhizobium sp. SUTN9-2]